ncbi:uncharacterized protein LOC120153343 [Hibiscus syriacus]|uniref:uncharacterized protein LOC120153343 n=1 Tax=Hibiscus syriacus TaxID=106335 RepID=UPI0019206B28|nr:uncharacterized protein LOC120153343 [Hibiscus syriacus]
MCKQDVETTLHALKDCTLTRKILTLPGLRNSIIIDVALSCKDWSVSSSPTSNAYVLHASPSGKWNKPPVGAIKINVDGAFRAHSGEATIGIVARNHHGMVVGGLARKLHSPQNSESAEALAFSLGIHFACERG